MLTVPMTPSAQIRQWAVWWRFRRWHGIQRDTWCAQFTNRPIVRADNNNGPFWRYNWPSRQILFSVNHTNEANMIKYIEELRHAQPPWIHGIVSSIAYLASYIVGKKIDLGYEVKFVTVASENLHNHQKKTIEEAFGVPVRTHYGLVEGVANISERPDGLYHIDEDFAAVEFIPLVHTSGYRIVGTNFSNPAFPLIRYDTGDIASLPEQDVESPFPGRIVGSFDGRSYDFIVLADGRHTHTIIGVFQAVDHIREAQISQVEPGQARILIVPDSNYTAKDECSIRRNIQSLYGNMLEISFEYVRAIPRTKSGKLRFITSTCNKWPSKDCSVLSYDGV